VAVELTLESPPTQTREQLIFEVFQAGGGQMTAYELAQACIEAGIWTPEELERLAMRAVQDACLRALKKKDHAGLSVCLPSAEKIDGAQPIWKARQYCLIEDYEVNVRAHVKQRNEDHTVAVKLAAECEQRYGHVIDIPELPAV
jgi:hypothetical protein